MLDFRVGLVCALIANVNRNPKKQPKAFKPQDFMPKRGRKRKKKQEPEEMIAQLKIMNAAFGGEEIKDGD